MRLWDLETGKVIQTFRDNENDANDVDYCPDGKWILSGSYDKTVRLYRIN